MNRIKNVEAVQTITLFPTAYTKCQIGQDWFLNEFEVRFIPDKYYPDYMEVDAFIQENIEGKEMNIEKAVKTLKDFLLKYEPVRVDITDHIRKCKTHFNVDVTV